MAVPRRGHIYSCHIRDTVALCRYNNFQRGEVPLAIQCDPGLPEFEYLGSASQYKAYENQIQKGSRYRNQTYARHVTSARRILIITQL